MTQNQNTEISMVLVGETNVQGRRDPVSAFENVLPLLQSADLLFGHLEAPLAVPSQDPNRPDIPHKQGWHHSGPEVVSAFQNSGFDVVSLASNVMYGPRAAIDTVQALDAAGIRHCGAGRDIEHARRPAVVRIQDVEVGFLSYTSVYWPVDHAAGPNTPGVATVKIHTAYQPSRRALEMPGAPPVVRTWADPPELEAVCADIRRLDATVDIVVVSMHWGLSGSTQTIEYQREVARAAIEAGADVIIGHHPHRPQAIEVINGRPVFYSTGNFAFDWDKMRGRNLEGMAIRCVIRDRSLARISFVPTQRNQDNLVTPLSPSQGAGRVLYRQIKELSRPYGTHLTAIGDEVVVEAETP